MGPHEGKLSRNGFLDIIKAFCILFVIITHDSISDSFRLKTLFPFWINMAVPMFMIISGYVYAISFEKITSPNFGRPMRLHSLFRNLFATPFRLSWRFASKQ